MNITKEKVMSLLIASAAISANEILRGFVKDDLISATLFGTLSIIMLIAYMKIGEKE